MPQGGSASDNVIKIFRKHLQGKLHIWPSTGKGADYMRGVAVGMGLESWNYIGAENGGLLMLRSAVSPMSYNSINITRDVNGLSDFMCEIELDGFNCTFKLHNNRMNIFSFETQSKTS